MAETVVAAATEKPVFDSAAFILEQNEKEAARRAGVPYVAKVAAAAAAVATEPAKQPNRQDRRALNNAQQALGAEKARREIAEAELAKLKNGAAAPAAAAVVDEDPEPKRQSFTTDAEYTRAVGAWDRRKEAKDATATAAETTANQGALAALQAAIVAADTKAVEDQKLIPDWDAVKLAASESEDQPEFTPAEHPYLMRMIATSDVKAFVLRHLAVHPEEMEKLLDSTSDLVAQTDLFRRLEGRVEKPHSSDKKVIETKLVDGKLAAAKPAETEADRDAKKAKPSEAGAPTGGSAPATELSPTLADGKTMNPAWKERENARAAARR
jgi:hypothetical protein